MAKPHKFILIFVDILKFSINNDLFFWQMSGIVLYHHQSFGSAEAMHSQFFAQKANCSFYILAISMEVTKILSCQAIYQDSQV